MVAIAVLLSFGSCIVVREDLAFLFSSVCACFAAGASELLGKLKTRVVQNAHTHTLSLSFSLCFHEGAQRVSSPRMLVLGVAAAELFQARSVCGVALGTGVGSWLALS